MNEIHPPAQSVKTLFKALLLAVVLALIILLTAVLPAEYGIDPTGLGRLSGLNKLAEPIEPLAVCDDKALLQQNRVKIIVPAASGIEYKFHLNKGDALEYSWVSSGGSLYFDFHGEPQGDTTGYFKSYKESTAAKDSGSQVMPFVGSHGWYWKNESASAITVSLQTKGVYQILGLR